MCSLMEIKESINVLSDLPGAILITNVDGKILFVNEKFCEMTGYSKEEVLGENPRLLKSGIHSDAFYKEMWETILSGTEYENEIVNKKKSGDLYTAKIAIKPFRNKEVEGNPVENFIALVTDVSHTKRMEDKWRAIINGLPNIVIAIYNQNRICVELYPENVVNEIPWFKDLLGNEYSATPDREENKKQHNACLDKVDAEPSKHFTYEYFVNVKKESGENVDKIYDASYSRYNHNKFLVVIRDVTESKVNKLRNLVKSSIDEIKKASAHDEGRS